MKRLGLVIISIVMAISISACSLSHVSKEIEDQVTNAVQEDNEYVLSVKKGHPVSYPNKTYEEAFKNFFGSPTWKYFLGTVEGSDENGDGKPDYKKDNVDIVEFTGYFTYNDVEVKARIQFTLDTDSNTFTATYLAFNDVPQNMLMLTSLIDTAFTDGEVESSTSNNQSYDVNLPSDNNDYDYTDHNDYYDYGSLDFVGKYEGSNGYTIIFNAYTSVEPGKKEIGNVGIYLDGELITKSTVSLCDYSYDAQVYEYSEIYQIDPPELDAYIAFYYLDGDIALDYIDIGYDRFDTFIMTEHFVS